MPLFTDNPFEKMMIQKPNGRRDNAPPVPYPPACASCPYKGQSPCVGYCLKQVQEKKLSLIHISAKREMTNAFLITDDDIIICDPEAEYFPLCSV